MSLPGPTYPQVAERLRLREQRAAHRAEVIAAWRARHPEATCGDAVAKRLADLEREFGGSAEGRR